MKKLIALFLFLPLLAFGKDYLLSKEEFLKRLDQGMITLEKSPIVSTNQEVLNHMLAGFKKEFPGFKDEMFYISYLKTNQYTYLVFYEWYDRGCVFGFTEPRKYEGKEDKARVDLGIAEKNSYEKIDSKYCSKLLGIEIPNGPLTRLPGAIKIETPATPKKK